MRFKSPRIRPQDLAEPHPQRASVLKLRAGLDNPYLQEGFARKVLHNMVPLAAPPSPTEGERKGRGVRIEDVQRLISKMHVKLRPKKKGEPFPREQQQKFKEVLREYFRDLSPGGALVERAITPAGAKNARDRLTPNMAGRGRNSQKHIETVNSKSLVSTKRRVPASARGENPFAKTVMDERPTIKSPIQPNQHTAQRRKPRIKMGPKSIIILKKNALKRIVEMKLGMEENKSFIQSREAARIIMTKSGMTTNKSATPVEKEPEVEDEDDRLTVIEKDCDNDYSFICSSLNGLYA